MNFMSNMTIKSKIRLAFGTVLCFAAIPCVYAAMAAPNTAGRLLAGCMFLAVTAVVVFFAMTLGADLEAGAKGAAAAAARLASGDLSRRTTTPDERRQDELGALESALNQTAEMLYALTSAVKSMATAAEKGNVPELGGSFGGAYREAGEAAVRALRTTVECITDLSACVSNLAAGQFEAVRGAQFGGMTEYKRTAEQSRESIRALALETQKLADAAVGRSQGARVNLNLYKDGWSVIPSAVASLTDGLTAPLDEVTKVLAAAAAGELGARVEGNYRGGHLELKNAVNQLLVKLSQYMADLSAALERVSRDGANTRFSGGYSGDFLKAVEAFNRMIEAYRTQEAQRKESAAKPDAARRRSATTGLAKPALAAKKNPVAAARPIVLNPVSRGSIPSGAHVYDRRDFGKY